MVDKKHLLPTSLLTYDYPYVVQPETPPLPSSGAKKDVAVQSHIQVRAPRSSDEIVLYNFDPKQKLLTAPPKIPLKPPSKEKFEEPKLRKRKVKKRVRKISDSDLSLPRIEISKAKISGMVETIEEEPEEEDDFEEFEEEEKLDETAAEDLQKLVSLTLRKKKVKRKPGKRAKEVCMRPERLKTISEILNTIFPPKVWIENGLEWKQQISLQPANREDVLQLTEMLDRSLDEVQAREKGICLHRTQLYMSCFEEIIRHEIINCTERGILLLRLKNEAIMTIKHWQDLYDFSFSYDYKQDSVQDTKEKKAIRYQECLLRREMKKLKKEIAALETEKNKLTYVTESREQFEEENRKWLNQNHAQVVEKLKKAIRQFDVLYNMTKLRAVPLFIPPKYLDYEDKQRKRTAIEKGTE